jgi:fatty-acyl-CoA synthase
VKGPTLMLGYLRVAAEDVFDAEGYIATGDVASSTRGGGAA